MEHEGQNLKRRSVSRVLISVSDKSGIVEFAKILGERDKDLLFSLYIVHSHLFSLTYVFFPHFSHLSPILI